MTQVLASSVQVPFYVAGGVLAVWAVVLTGIGISRERFPGRLEKLVSAISAVLVAIAIAAAIITAIEEEKEEEETGHGVGAVPYLRT